MNIHCFRSTLKRRKLFLSARGKKGMIDLTYIEGKKWNDPFVWQDAVASWKKKSNAARARKKRWHFGNDVETVSWFPFDRHTIRIDVSPLRVRIIYLIAKPERHKYRSERNASIFLLVNMRLRPREKSHRENALSGFIFPHPLPPPPPPPFLCSCFVTPSAHKPFARKCNGASVTVVKHADDLHASETFIIAWDKIGIP